MEIRKSEKGIHIYFYPDGVCRPPPFHCICLNSNSPNLGKVCLKRELAVDKFFLVLKSSFATTTVAALLLALPLPISFTQ